MTRVEANQTILIVDNSDDDYDVTVRALSRDPSLPNPVHRCEDGQQALDCLFHRGAYQDADKSVLPGIILLDLNMPGIDGRMVLQALKSDASLRRIPVIILSNSDAERDIEDCYRMGANTYICKPFDLSEFSDAMHHLKEYWFKVAILPNV